MENTGFMMDHQWSILMLWLIRQGNSGDQHMVTNRIGTTRQWPVFLRENLSLLSEEIPISRHWPSRWRQTTKAGKYPVSSMTVTCWLQSWENVKLGNKTSFLKSHALNGIYRSKSHTLFSRSGVRRPLFLSGYCLEFCIHRYVCLPLSLFLFHTCIHT